MKNRIFDTELLDKIKGDKPTYIIGTDTYDEKSLAYCLCKNTNGITEILLAKTMNNKEKFNKEVNNLSKYFNATRIVEKL